jgi:hypothetical protein
MSIPTISTQLPIQAEALQKEALAAAYRATAYQLSLHGTTYVLRVGEHNPCLDSWLAAMGFSRWAWLTAVNPGSQRLSGEANAARLAELEARLVGAGWLFHRGAAMSDAGDWPAEASLFVPGLDAETALRFAAKYGQNAILVGQIGEPVALSWVNLAAA